MGKEQMTPYRRLARQMAESTESVLTETEYYTAITALLRHLSVRAEASLIRPDSQEALDNSTQYMVAAQTFNHYGTALIAMDDIEEAEIGIFTQEDSDDDPSPEDIN